MFRKIKKIRTKDNLFMMITDVEKNSIKWKLNCFNGGLKWHRLLIRNQIRKNFDVWKGKKEMSFVIYE